MAAADALPPLIAPSPTDPFHLFLRLQGRVSRRTFWLYGVLVPLSAGLVGLALLEIAGLNNELSEGLMNLLLAWPSIAVSVKRWHDRDRSGWWVLVALIPVVGVLWMLVDNGLLKGTAGPNRYGPDPLAPADPPPLI